MLIFLSAIGWTCPSIFTSVKYLLFKSKLTSSFATLPLNLLLSTSLITPLVEKALLIFCSKVFTFSFVPISKEKASLLKLEKTPISSVNFTKLLKLLSNFL